jgi:hypothetical protein
MSYEYISNRPVRHLFSSLTCFLASIMSRSIAVTAYLLQRVNALDGEWGSCRRHTFQSHESIPKWASECRRRRKLRTHSLPSGS